MKLFSKRGKILILIIVAILVLSLNFFQKEVKGFFYTFSAPIQRTFWGAGGNVSNFLGGFFNSGNLQSENNELKSTTQELLAENASLKELKKENDTLRETLQLGIQKDFHLAYIEVIGKDIGQESILINQGTKSGLSLGMPVITQQKILLGRISAVYENSSRVMLISSKESSFDAKIPDTDITGVAKGAGNGKIELDLVPREKNLQEGVSVVSSSLGGIYPSGLLVGSVKKAEKDDVSPFYRAEIAPLFDIAKTEAVFVILNFINSGL